MSLASAADEFSTLHLGDRRLEQRAVQLVRAIEKNPSRGFPQIYGTESDLEAHYRFMNNDRVVADALGEAHADASWQRAARRVEEPVLAIADTTEFVFNGEVPREGLMPKRNGSAFFGHFTLLATESESPEVLGIVAHNATVHEDKRWYEVSDASEERELLLSGFGRWLRQVEHVRETAPADQMLIHVMDREADDYELMVQVLSQHDDFVIRSQYDRRLFELESTLFEALSDVSFMVSRDVPLSRRGKRRPPVSKRRHHPRDHRTARLSVRYGFVTIKRPNGTEPLGSPSLELSFIEVIELEPPDGVEPVHWRLLSSLPVYGEEDALRIIDIYRKRWLIEEFFKSLKTGCAAEKRQSRSLASLWRTITLLVPIAWRLLVLRALAREAPGAAGQVVIDDIEMLALRSRVTKRLLSKKPTARQVMLAVARLGGHLRSNGEPGWLVLGRGMDELLTMAEAWRAALKFAQEGGLSEK